jgi:alpha-glucosidase (family GH31 glycosyl hydrolase)
MHLDFDLTRDDPWATAFLAYYFLREGSGNLALEGYRRLVSGSSFDEAALALWVVSETAAVPGPGATVLDNDRTMLDRIAVRVGVEFETPSANWMDLGVPGVYATRLALAWGALSAFRNATGDEAVAGVLPSVKESFFQHFLDGGRLRSRRGGESLFTDVVLCSVPFGLMDPGNQIMVESVVQIEARQYRGGFAFSADTAWFGGTPRADLDALMSWYYSERGDLGRARDLVLRGSSEPLSARAEVLKALASQNLSRVQGVGSSLALDVDHVPQGNGSRYHVQSRSRQPFCPVAGEPVILRVVVRPYSPEVRVRVVVEGSPTSIKAVHVGSDGTEGWFEATLDGSMIHPGQTVTYRFEAHSPTGTGDSETFSFVPGLRTAVTAIEPASDGRMILITESGDRIAVVVDHDATTQLIMIAGGGFALTQNGHTLAQTWEGLGLSPLSLDLSPDGRPLRVVLRLKVQPDEEFFGTGERFSALGLRGKRVDCWVFNQYRDQGLRTYIPLPFWQSTRGWGLRVLSQAWSETGFADRVEGMVEVTVDWDGEGTGFRFFSGSPWEIVRAYQAETGVAVIPPRWAFGPWMSSNNWDRQSLTLDQAHRTVDLGLPATVLVLEQWSDEATFYLFNDAVYDRKPGAERFCLTELRFPPGARWPDPKGMVDELHGLGLKVLLWQAPVMKYMDGLPHGQRDADEEYMLGQGWGIRQSDGSPYRTPDFEWFKRSLIPNLANPKEAAWWFSKRQYLFAEVGIDGIKTDGGEGVYGDDAQRNRYPVEYVGAFHRFVSEMTHGDGMTFSRAGFEGAHTIPAHWAGDERSTFEAFRNSIRAGLTAGLSGLPFWGWDFGGFNGDIPDAELYLRATQMAAFCPIMQYHAESKGEKNRDRTPWNIADRTGDPRVLPVYQSFARARMNLLPYLWAEAGACVESGAALMRALWTEVPEDPVYRPIDDQYLLGRSLLVAPVVHPGQRSRSVVFPPGRWVPLFGGAAVHGPVIREVEAPLEVLPVWYRSGDVVPLNLPQDGSFPGDVGSQWDGYTQLAFLVCSEDRVDYQYRTYAGAQISLRGRPRVDLEIDNPTEQPIVLVDEYGTRTRIPPFPRRV